MIWDQLTSRQLGSLSRHIPVLLPIAATEQHGAHLPVATDHLIASYFVRQLHDRIPDDVLILPTMTVGCSQHHMAFPGTLTFSHQTLISVIIDILESVVAHGFTNLVIFNSHGGNLAVGQVALEQFGARHPECQVVFATWWRIAAETLLGITETGRGGVGHACEFETSLIMHIAPDLVDTAQIAAGGNQGTYEWAEGDMLRGAKAGLFRSMQAMTPTGVYGDPRAASTAKGIRIEATVLKELQEIILSLASNHS
jgi:creatinine amidohydrolase